MDELVSWLVGALSPVNHRGLHQGCKGRDKSLCGICGQKMTIGIIKLKMLSQLKNIMGKEIFALLKPKT